MHSREPVFDLKAVLINKMGKDLLAYLPAKFLPALIAFISIPVYTRLFEPDQYAFYALIVPAVSLMVVIMFSWLFHSSLRFYAEQVRQGDKEKFLSTVFISWFSLILIAYGLAGAVFWLSPTGFYHLVEGPQAWLLLLAAALMISSHSMYSTVLDLLRSNRHSTAYACLAVAMPAGRLLGTAALVLFWQMGIEALFVSSILIESILCVAGLIVLKVKISLSAFSPALMKRIAAYGLPLVGSAVLALMLSLSDRYIVGFYHGAEAAGIYSMVYSLGASALQTVFMVLMLTAFPVIIQTWNKHGRESTEKLVSSLMHYYCAFTIPVVAGIAVLSRPLLAALTTAQYAGGHTVLPWVAAGFFCLGYSQYVNKIWELRERTAVLLALNGISVVVNIGLNFLFIPRYGYWAAGVTTVISYAFYLTSSWLLSRPHFRITVNPGATGKLLISTAVMIGVLILFKKAVVMSAAWLIVTISAGAAVYLAALLVMGEFKSEFFYIYDKIKVKV